MPYDIVTLNDPFAYCTTEQFFVFFINDFNPGAGKSCAYRSRFLFFIQVGEGAGRDASLSRNLPEFLLWIAFRKME